MLKNAIILGGISALVTGIAIGIQSNLSGQAGKLIGPVNTGFWTNFLGGTLAGILILFLSRFVSPEFKHITKPAFIITLVSGALGILIIMGISFSISRAGVAAGLSAVIFGQFLFGVIADSFGLGGLEPIPLDVRRIAGLVVMAISVILLLPRK
ncbi:MAG TPA: DMT family transporter [Pelolinea sp.]|nr:DMT family transporter [Pelolinea sp.]